MEWKWRVTAASRAFHFLAPLPDVPHRNGGASHVVGRQAIGQDLRMGNSRSAGKVKKRNAALVVTAALTMLLSACASSGGDDVREAAVPVVAGPLEESPKPVSAAVGTALDPKEAYVRVEVRNDSGRTVSIQSFDRSNTGNEQIITEFPNGATLDLWGAATLGADVWLRMAWCEDPAEQYTFVAGETLSPDEGCPTKSGSHMVAVDFRQTWTGAPWVNYSHNYPDSRGSWEPSPQQSYTWGPWSTQDPIEFVISRRNNWSEALDVHRYWVRITDASGA